MKRYFGDYSCIVNYYGGKMVRSDIFIPYKKIWSVFSGKLYVYDDVAVFKPYPDIINFCRDVSNKIIPIGDIVGYGRCMSYMHIYLKNGQVISLMAEVAGRKNNELESVLEQRRQFIYDNKAPIYSFEELEMIRKKKTNKL